MCGAQTNLNKYRVEGVQMSLCSKCGQHGIREKEPKRTFSFKSHTNKNQPEVIEMINENYSNLVKNAREKKGLKQKELAKKILERESLIHNVESGHMKPSMKLATKLEKFLDINLIIKYKEETKKSKEELNIQRSNHNNDEISDEKFTIGDMIKKRK